MNKKDIGALPRNQKTPLKGLGPLRIPLFITALILCFAVSAGAVTIEAGPDLHSVMGGLYGMSAAMRLFYDDTHKEQCPSLDELGYYLKTPPGDWADSYRTASINGDWWAGRRVPEFSAARRFVRDNASALGLYEQDGQSQWMGGAFVWTKVMAFGGRTRPLPEQPGLNAAQGEGADNQYLFLNAPGTDYYWKNTLIFTTSGHAAALQKFGTDARGPFVTTDSPAQARDTVTASPVEVPPDFSLGEGTEPELDARIGDVIFNPIPRQRDN